MACIIVASPCAVAMATMPPLLAVVANAGGHGVLVKSAAVLEESRAITGVAVDNTSTEGTPRLTDITVLPGTSLDEKEVLALAPMLRIPPSVRVVIRSSRRAGPALMLPAANMQVGVQVDQQDRKFPHQPESVVVVNAPSGSSGLDLAVNRAWA